MKITAAVLASLLAVACAYEPPPGYTPASMSIDQFDETIRAWQRQRSAGLMEEGSWLSLAGLFWLAEGENAVGSDANAVIVLPASAPSDSGTIVLEGDEAHFRAAEGVAVTHDGSAVEEIVMKPDSSGEPTVLRIGSVTFYVIERGGKFGVRIKDSESAARRDFRGLEYFPVDPSMRIVARFEPYEPAKEIPVSNVLGMVEPMKSPGAIVFEIGGDVHRLDPVIESPDADELFVMFADPTNRESTYPAGRYLYTGMPDASGHVVIDFNKAYNPPCAFTDFATCPLPPPQNRLPVPVRAGEKRYAGTDH